jgi:pyrimidine operon attenuation protein/uracil phosphoribosyltransferase
MSNIRIMAPEQVRRTLRRLAHEILERNRGAANLVVLGIAHRGEAIGHAMAAILREIDGDSVPSHGLDVTGYRDDRGDSGVSPPAPDGMPSLADRDVILVDDVLFTGRTVRAALDAVIRYGRPRSIQLAVLVDRGHREFPIQADYVGRSLPTKHQERVKVLWGEEPAVEIVE